MRWVMRWILAIILILLILCEIELWRIEDRLNAVEACTDHFVCPNAEKLR